MGENIEDTQRLNHLGNFYSIPDPLCVARFLQKTPTLLEVLKNAEPYLETYFGPFPLVVLEVIRDPELENVEELIGYIRTALPVDESLDRLEQFDRNWFLEQLDRVGEHFTFSLEPV